MLMLRIYLFSIWVAILILTQYGLTSIILATLGWLSGLMFKSLVVQVDRIDALVEQVRVLELDASACESKVKNLEAELSALTIANSSLESSVESLETRVLELELQSMR